MTSNIPFERSAYSTSQIHEYLQYVRFPMIPSITEIENGQFRCTIGSLRTLVRLNRMTFPFENTAMH